MIISIQTQQGMINFCLNAALLKLLAGVGVVLMLFTGYVAVQMAQFILACTPQQFLRIVLFTAFLIALFAVGFVGRFALSKVGAK